MKNKRKLLLSFLALPLIVGLVSCETAEPVEEVETLIPSIQINGSSTIEIGETRLYTISVENITGSFEWSSSDETVATVTDSGLVTAVSTGTTTLEVMSVDQNDVTATLDINVVDPSVEYSVKFRNYDGSLLYQTYVSEGEAATYVGVTPTRPSTHDREFRFEYWDKDLTSIQEDTETYAVYSESDFSDWFFVESGTNYAISAYVGDATSVTTPTTFNGRLVTTISGGAFVTATQLEEIVVSDGILTLQNDAFSNLKNIKKVTLPGTIYNMGQYLFYNCSALEEVILGEGIQTLSYRTFMYCYSLTSLTLPSTLTSLGQQAIYYCGIEELVIPENCNEFGNNAISRNDSLVKLDILCEGEVTFGGSALSFNSNLAEINFNGHYADNTIPTALYRSTAITEFVMPDSVTTVNSLAFSTTTSLTSMTLSNNLVSVVNDAFTDCAAFTYSEDSSDPYPGVVFKENSSLKIENLLLTNDAVSGNGRRAVYRFSAFNSTSIDFSSMNVTEVGQYLFYTYYYLTSLTYDKITYWGDRSFYWSGTTVVNDGETTFNVDDDITYIGVRTFQNDGNLSSLQYNNLVISSSFDGTYTIPSYAFHSMTTVNRVEITKDSGIHTIGESALGYLGTASIYIPKSVTTIAYHGIYYASGGGDYTIYYEGTEEEWNAIDFATNAYNTSATILYEQDSLPE